MRKTIKQLQGESDYWRIKFINEQHRAEAAEAKLAAREKQKAVGVARMELTIGKEGLRYYQCFVDMRPDLVVAELNTGMELFTRPAPSADLVALVPDAAGIHDMDPQSKDVEVVTAIAQCEGWNACRAAMLRNIEEVKAK